MNARYGEPTGKQIEEAKALIFLAETKKALRDQEHIWDMTLELEVTYTVHNQRLYLMHASKDGQSITGADGYKIHPVNGTPTTTAWHLAIDARTARKQLADH
ncbi:hypothetical protein M707_21940 [Arthrobacter sp. AK-YN10]|nr:hypothetical protein M707_21940 [Arthrobacter sp. AK-YN10]